ncbi:MAG: hypothetical protein LBM71_04075 [Elusimicrobiota bacterium]|jgi:hypothetical protein|nr:hypothetical protein [Elusimicrobiota bacterium]
MEKILNSFKVSFRKGPIIGILDMLFRLFSLVLWLLLVKLLFSFVWEAIFFESVLSEKMWWLCYSAMIFVMATVLAYTAVWDRHA